ncbi:hypothetical protein H4S08_001974 [Coemansia sp. RSA 1365]|nr:hypothetical protein H4S08_001974 [Coemansia sp. RSA 1365]
MSRQRMARAVACALECAGTENAAATFFSHTNCVHFSDLRQRKTDAGAHSQH